VDLNIKSRSIDIGDQGEYVFMRRFPMAIQMPRGHKGYDFLLDGVRINVKAACRSTGYSPPSWRFSLKRGIQHNTDSICCIAFNHHLWCKVVHVWMIPISVVGSVVALSIYDTTKSLERWKAYEII
jgi:hypothetical protein